MNPLSKLSNDELETRLKDLVAKERKLLHVILEHIKEVDLRKLYLERAYSSIYEYLVKELNYSGSAAMRRLEAARLLREVPMVAEKIQEGSLNLSQIGELSRAIKEKEKVAGAQVSTLQKTELVVAISGMTTQETQKELSVALDIVLHEPERQRVQKDSSVQLSLTLSQEQYQLLLQCKDMAAHLLQRKHRDSSWASLFEVLAAQFLTRKGSIMITNTSEAETERINKTLTPKVRKGILIRDQCCQYRDPQTGKQCKSTYALQVDHKTAQWAGGNHSKQNLHVLCARHNIFKYHKEAQIRYTSLDIFEQA